MGVDAITALEYEWPYLLTFLPPTEQLEASAAQFGAIVRKRSVNDAESLLRPALAYGYCGLSLRQTAAWAEACNIASLSDVALLNRLRKSSDWLGHLLGLKLADISGFAAMSSPFRLRLVDATAISGQGSRGTDWRIHLSYNLSSLSIDHIELTDHAGGESLTRFPMSPGDLVLGDRGYAHRAGFYAVKNAGADFLVRIPWQSVPLLTSAGESFDLIAALRSVREAAIASIDVQIAGDKKRKLPAMAARLLVLRKSETAAAKSRTKVLAERSRKSETVDPRSLEAASYIILLTSTTEAQLAAVQALELYRFRWQIELVFKRLKGLIGLGNMPAKDVGLARSLLYAKLLAALILDDLTDRFLAISPWGYPLRT